MSWQIITITHPLWLHTPSGHLLLHTWTDKRNHQTIIAYSCYMWTEEQQTESEFAWELLWEEQLGGGIALRRLFWELVIWRPETLGHVWWCLCLMWAFENFSMGWLLDGAWVHSSVWYTSNGSGSGNWGVELSKAALQKAAPCEQGKEKTEEQQTEREFAWGTVERGSYKEDDSMHAFACQGIGVCTCVFVFVFLFSLLCFLQPWCPPKQASMETGSVAVT